MLQPLVILYLVLVFLLCPVGAYVVTTYKRKTRRYDEEAVKEACDMYLESDASYRTIEKKKGIPKSSLHTFVQRKGRKTKTKGRPRTFSRETEAHVVKLLKTTAALGWPLDRADLTELFTNLVQKAGMKTQFSSGRPGKDFIRAFLNRHKEDLSLKKTEILKLKRAQAEHPRVIKTFIASLRQAFSLAGIDPDNLNDARRVLNLDETGFSSKASAKKVIVERGKNAYNLQPTEGKTNYSVLFAGNAAGWLCPPYVVYQGCLMSMPAGWVLNGPEGAGYTTTKNGWMDANSFLLFIVWFDDKIKQQQLKKPVVVIIDGYSSHLTYECLEEANKRLIYFVQLPANASHILQALDVSVFGPAKTEWAKIVKQWFRETRHKNISKAVFPVLLRELVDRMPSANLISGFAATGAWPLGEERLLKKVEGRGVYKAAAAPSQSLDIAQPPDAASPQCSPVAAPSQDADSDIEEFVFRTPSGSEPLTPASPEHSSQLDLFASPPSPSPLVIKVGSISSCGTNNTAEYIVQAVTEILTPPPGQLTIRALNNMKAKEKVLKNGVINSDHAMKALQDKRQVGLDKIAAREAKVAAREQVKRDKAAQKKAKADAKEATKIKKELQAQKTGSGKERKRKVELLSSESESEAELSDFFESCQGPSHSPRRSKRLKKE